VIKNIMKRFVSAVIILLALSIFVFALFYIAPGNPARLIAGEKASQTVLDQVTHNLGLDKPLWQQYLLFVSHALSGNFGISYRNQMPVAGLIASRLPVTFSLVGGAVVLWLLIGIPLGVVSATHPGTWKDRLAQILSQLFISFPSFVLGMFLLYLLYFLPKRHKFTLFPPGGYSQLANGFAQWAWHMTLPWLTLALLMAALYQRLTRAEMMDVLGEDYIRTARAKGLPEHKVIYKHGLRSTLTVLTTQLGADIGSLLSGSIIIEQVFGLQGVGSLAVTSVNTQDRPVIIGVVLLGGFFIVMMNLLVDVLHVALEPTLRK
jgi:peptide/nickel transport system permease protein